DILKVDGHQLYISGGARQGLKVGDTVAILQQGERVKSAQTGFDIALPSKPVGQARIVGFFGDNETNEGSVAEILSGEVKNAPTTALYISEIKEYRLCDPGSFLLCSHCCQPVPCPRRPFARDRPRPASSCPE